MAWAETGAPRSSLGVVDHSGGVRRFSLRIASCETLAIQLGTVVAPDPPPSVLSVPSSASSARLGPLHLRGGARYSGRSAPLPHVAIFTARGIARSGGWLFFASSPASPRSH